MADIRLATDFFDHPKTLMLQADHGAEAVLSLQRIWCWAATNRSKGILRGLDKKRLMIIARCSEAVIDSMIKEGFIDHKKNIYSLHNWKKNQSYAFYAEERSAKARKAAKARYSAKTKKKEPCSEHARGIAEKVLKQDSSTAPSPDPDPVPNPTPKPSTKPSSPKASPPEAIELATRLGRLIYQRNPLHAGLQESTRDKTFTTWAVEIDRAMRIDHRTEESLERVIDWCQADSFWCSNILSGVKLRKQFDQLFEKMTQIQSGNGKGSRSGASTVGEEMIRRLREQEDEEERSGGTDKRLKPSIPQLAIGKE